MSSTSPPIPAAQPPDSTTDLKATAKWLVATTGSIAALLVAGTQLKDVSLVGGPVVIGAMAFALLAIVAVGAILRRAIEVLATPRPTLAWLAALDNADGGAYPKPRLDEPKNPLVQLLVVERRLELLGPKRDAIAQLITDRSALQRVVLSGQKGQVAGRTYDPAVAGDLAAAQAQALDVERRIDELIRAAEQWEVSRRFGRLTQLVSIAGVLFVVGVLGFVWLTSKPPPSPNVTQPVPVRVLAPTDPAKLRSTGLEAACAGQPLDGFAVGGTLAEPIVVIAGTQTCRAQKLKPSDYLVVVPNVPTNR